MHATEQNIKCPGCGYIFEKGAGLIAHIYANQCDNRGGGLSNSVNELKIRETRAAAALHMNQLLNRPSETGALIAAMQPSETGDFRSVDGSAGGVALTPSYLDADIPNSENVAASTIMRTSNVGDDGQTTFKDGGSVGPNMADIVDWPTVEDSKVMGKKKEGSVIQGLGALTVRDSNGSGLKSPGLSEALIPGIKPIPEIGEWTAPTMPDFRRNIVPSESGSLHIIRTDWDAMKFERHGLDGHYHCPFTGCKYVWSGCNLSMFGFRKANYVQGQLPGTQRSIIPLDIRLSPGHGPSLPQMSQGIQIYASTHSAYGIEQRALQNKGHLWLRQRASRGFRWVSGCQGTS